MELKLFECRHEVGDEAGQQVDQGLAIAVHEHSAGEGIHGATRPATRMEDGSYLLRYSQQRSFSSVQATSSAPAEWAQLFIGYRNCDGDVLKRKMLDLLETYHAMETWDDRRIDARQLVL
jgi:D-aminopeptidase